LIVEELQSALQRLAVAFVLGAFDFAQDPSALQHQSVDLAGNLGLFRVERYALCLSPAFFGILLLLLYVLTFKTSCHISILRLIGVRHLKSLFLGQERVLLAVGQADHQRVDLADLFVLDAE